ncbi:MAG: ABC transporter permease [Bryobacteraceae bacterium]
MNDLRYALRALRTNPGFTITAVVVLALGIGANSAIFTVVDSVLLRPLPYKDPGRLYALMAAHVTTPGDLRFTTLSDAGYVDFERQSNAFDSMAAYAMHSLNLTGSGEPVQVPAWQLSPRFFSILGARAELGRAFRSEEDQPAHANVVLLSDRLWRSRFRADPAILGQTILLDAAPRTVIGVMPATFDFFPGPSDLWVPLVLDPARHTLAYLHVVARLKASVTPAAAEAEIESIARHRDQSFSRNGRHDTARLFPLRTVIVKNARPLLLIFLGAVGCVLLIACANVATLLLARGAARHHDIAVRASLGAGRWRLIRQLLTESALLALAGGVLGLIAAMWGVDALLALAPTGKIPRAADVHINLAVLAFTLLISLAAGLLFGVAPALKLSRVSLNQALQHGARTVADSARLRHALVIAEIALSLILLAGAGLLLKSFLRLRAVDPGFRVENVLALSVDLSPNTYRTPAQCQAFLQQTLDRIRSTPGVQSAAAINWLPFGSLDVTGDVSVAGQPPANPPYIVTKPATAPGYFRAMGIRLLRGRDFDDRDTAASPPVAIVTSDLARRFWPHDDPIGKRVELWGKDNPPTVVGVVSLVQQGSLADSPTGAVYQPLTQAGRLMFLQHLTFVVRTASEPVRLAPTLRVQLREVDPNQPIQFLERLESRIDASLDEPRFQTRLLGAFAALALALAAVGIYGVMAYTVAQRTREIGVRIAVGAQSADILRLVLRQSFALSGVGILLGIAGAAVVTRVLSQLLFGVKPIDPVTFLLVSILLVLVAAAATVFPARRAAKVDPVVALRYE